MDTQGMLVLAITLGIIVISMMFVLARKPGKQTTYRFRGVDKTIQMKLAMIVPGETVAVLKLKSPGVVTNKVAHLGVVTGFGRDGKIVMRKPNGILVKRSARRVEALANLN